MKLAQLLGKRNPGEGIVLALPSSYLNSAQGERKNTQLLLLFAMGVARQLFEASREDSLSSMSRTIMKMRISRLFYNNWYGIDINS